MDLKNASQTLINTYHTPHPPHFQMRKPSDSIWHSHLPAALRVGAVKCSLWDSFWSSDLGVILFPVDRMLSPPLKLGQPSLALEFNLTYWKPKKKLANFGKIKVFELCLTLCDPMDSSLWNSPGQKTGVGSCCLLQRIFPIQGLNPEAPTLQVNSLSAEPPGKPKNIGIGSLSFLQRVFQTQTPSNWGLLHCR